MPVLSLDVIQSEHMTVERTRWIRVRRSWVDRLCGKVNYARLIAGMIVTVVVQLPPVCTSISTWVFAATLLYGLILIVFHPHRVRISHRPTKIVERVPRDDVMMIDPHTIVVHPATWTKLLYRLAEMDVEMRDFGAAMMEQFSDGIEHKPCLWRDSGSFLFKN